MPVVLDSCRCTTLHPPCSRSALLQMQRWWLNWPGHAVIKHLALQLEAMERLRQQAMQQQQAGQQPAGEGGSGCSSTSQAG